uniref:Integral membrane protein n=1 Tax=Streptomyces sp. NBC_00093 TaxID=2975649 RepID=A0AAU1ZUV5_9ACTN
MTAGWGARTLRAAVFAAVCVLLAALGHVLMSGSSVPWWTLVAGTVVMAGAGWCLAGRERGLPLVVGVVVVAQGALHSAFSFARSTVGTSADSMDMTHTGMDADAGMDTGMVMGLGHMAHGGHGTDALSSSYGMLAAHTLAALLCGLWLAYGERAAFRILRAVAGRLVAPLRLALARPVTPDRPRLRPRRGTSDRAPRLLPLVHAITSRGPPTGLAVI